MKPTAVTKKQIKLKIDERWQFCQTQNEQQYMRQMSESKKVEATISEIKCLNQKMLTAISETKGEIRKAEITTSETNV